MQNKMNIFEIKSYETKNFFINFVVTLKKNIYKFLKKNLVSMITA